MEYVATLDHESLLVRRGTRSGLFTMVAVHSTVRGPALGGCRMWHYDDARAAVRDVLRLSEAMSYKAACAGLPMGGGKGVVMLPGPVADLGRARGDVLRDFADTVEAMGGAYRTAEDVGTSARDMQVIAGRTAHVTGLSCSRGGSGDPSPWTALGVLEAIRVACDEHFGSPALEGRTVAISGMGSVGGRLAVACAKAGAKLVVTDIDRSKRDAAKALGARWVTPAKIVSAPADVFAPCALGGVFDAENAVTVGAPVIAGAANNQLTDNGVARVLADRGVLWVPDFVANAGGIVNINVELRPEGYDPKQARTDVLAIGDTVRRVLSGASKRRTPLAAAMALAAERLEGADA